MAVQGNSNAASWYDRSAMYNQLKAIDGYKGNEVAINGILTELDKGNMKILADKGLTDKVTLTTVRPFLPAPNKYDAASFEKVMFKLETFDYLAALQLLFTVGKQMSGVSREMRHDDREAAYAMNMSAAQAIRDAGEAEFRSALTSAIVSITFSALSMAGTVGGAVASFKFKGVEEIVTAAKTVMKVSGELSKLGQSAGSLAGAGDKLDATKYNAKQKEYEALAQRFQSLESESADYQKAYAELIQHVIQMVKETTQNQLAVDQHIYQNM